jgi:hypothetical protein
MVIMNEQEFNQQVEAIYNQPANTAFNVYLNAIANDNNFCLLGRIDAFNQIIGNRVNQQYLLQIGNNGEANFYVTDQNQPGNLLRVDNWGLMINDAWLIGGINGRSTFNFVGVAVFNHNIEDLIAFNDLYLRGNGQHPITVTAREILGLKAAGYIPHITHDTLLFTPSGRDTTIFDFVDYHKALDDNQIPQSDAIFNYLSPVFS